MTNGRNRCGANVSNLKHESLRELSITVCHRRIRAFKDRPHIVSSLLDQAGYRVTEVSDGRLPLDKTDVLWISDNANWFPAVCEQLRVLPRAKRPITVIWHTEPLPPPRSAGLPQPNLNLREIAKILLSDRLATDVYTNYFRLRALMKKGIPDLLAVSTPGRQEFLAEQGLSSDYVPLGYHRSEYGYDMGLQRDIQVLFLGALTIRRRKKLLRKLRASGIPVVAGGSWSDPAYWGENRTRLLNRAEILLNLQRYPGELSGMRLILGMANKALVISEPMHKPGGFIPGKHYISVTSDEMPEAIEYYLNHDDERERIVEEGHRLVTRELTMERSISTILESIKEHLDDLRSVRARQSCS